jgi:chorismate mutase
MNHIVQVWLTRLGFDSALRRQADQIAAACADAVSSRLNGATTIGSSAEARGYVRARAATVINRRVADARTIPPRFREQVVEMVSDRIIDRFAPRVVHHQAAPLRRAA